ncbi:hypothetical protein ABPG74_019613 [Tetrahymena malaccensis]
MKFLIIRIIFTVSFPIILGVGFVSIMFYDLLWEALDQWESESIQWMNKNQQQILFNSIYSQQVLLEYSFNQLELHSVIMKGLLNKYQSGKMICIFKHFQFAFTLTNTLKKDNHKTTYDFCSFREFMLNQCPQNIYDQIDQSIFYAQLYFVRSVFKYDLLTPEQRYFIKMNADLSFYTGAAYLSAQNNGIIQITDFHNSDLTSIKTESPSVQKLNQKQIKIRIIIINIIISLYNYTLSTYYKCLGTEFLEPYDPRCRFWYQYAKQNEGIFIYEAYNDSLSGTLQMNLAQKILKDSQFYSVISIIFIMQNLMQLYSAQISRNSYTVLFHEFDIQVFYHPLHVFNQPITWVDMEFFNINQFCSDHKEKMQFCQSQKQLLSNQINQTVEFIKNGNYSIENKVNIEQLYQRWERFGQKEVSIIFPIKSKLKGYNNQKPYSFAILLVARVITDNTDQLKLFNLIDAQIFRIYLIVGFVVLSILILVFITNYGVFLVYQIQKPIKLLTLFLKKSYQEQLTQQKQDKINMLDQKTQQKKQKKNIQKKRLSLSKKNSNNNGSIQKIISNTKDNLTLITKNTQTQELFFKQDGTPLLQNVPIFSFQNKDISIQRFRGFDKYEDYQRSDIQLTQNNSQSPQIPKSVEFTYLNIQQKQVNEKYSISFGQNLLNKENLQITNSTPKITVEKSNVSIQNQYDELFNLKQENKSQILQGLKPLFQEMKIIKQAFQDLESLINYSIDAQNFNSEDFVKSLFHFSKAKSTFQQLKNQIGLGRCYYNLGLVSLLNNNYSLALEYFESSIQLSFESIGIDYQFLANYKIFKNSQNNYEEQIQILSKRIFSKAFCLKQQVLSQYYRDSNENIESDLVQKNFVIQQHNTQRIQKSYSEETIQLIIQSLNTFEIVLTLVENNQSSFSDIFKICLYQETIEIFIFLRQHNSQTFKRLIEKANQMMKNPKQYDSFINNTSQIYSVNLQILQIQKSRQLFLLGLIEQIQNNKIEAIQLFTQSIEEGSHYSPNLRKKVIFHFRQIIDDISDISLKNMIYHDKQYLLCSKKIPIDLTIVAQLDYCKESFTIENFLQNIQKFNFFEDQDRIQVLIYHTDIDIFMSYKIIQSSQDWNLIIDSFKNIERIILSDSMKKKLSWQEALYQSLQYIYEFRRLNDLVSLKKYFEQNQQTIQKNITYSSNQSSQLSETQKVVLVFSNDQDNDYSKLSQNLKTFQIVFKNQKPLVYHLKESANQNKIKKINSPFITYKTFTNESQLIHKLIQLRKEEILKEGQEFLSILYNF